MLSLPFYQRPTHILQLALAIIKGGHQTVLLFMLHHALAVFKEKKILYLAPIKNVPEGRILDE